MMFAIFSKEYLVNPRKKKMKTIVDFNNKKDISKCKHSSETSSEIVNMYIQDISKYFPSILEFFCYWFWLKYIHYYKTIKRSNE